MSAQPPKGKVIVYAEDDLVTLTAYKNRLEQEGFEVKGARDGVEAMKIMSTCVPDLVLLDLQLPRLDGCEVLKFIRTNPKLKAVPVVTLSTNSILDVPHEPYLEHADRRLLKGNCTFPELLGVIQELLGTGPKDMTAPAG